VFHGNFDEFDLMMAEAVEPDYPLAPSWLARGSGTSND
jgi:hypothetical protein